VQSDLSYGEICYEQTDKNSDFALFPIQDPRVKLRFKVLFKKFHPRINLTTLFLTKIYLLTLRPKKQNLKKPVLGGYPKEHVFQNSEYEVHQVGPKDSGDPNFVSHRQRRVTDEKKLSLKSCHH
jgi:hypothetical protein